MTKIPTEGTSNSGSSSIPLPVLPSDAVDSDWSDDLNQRRCGLIDKDIQGTITDEERIELNSLVERMRHHRRRIAPLPIDEAKSLHRRLLELKETNAGESVTHARTKPLNVPRNREGLDFDAIAKLAEDLRNFEIIAKQLRNSIVLTSAFDDRCQQAIDIAHELFHHAPTWVCFFRESLSKDGMIRKLFGSEPEYIAFERTEAYSDILLMLTALRSQQLPETDANDPQRMITVRIPTSLHETLCDEAEHMAISVEKLVISRMLQPLDSKLIPESNDGPRLRRRKRSN